MISLKQITATQRRLTEQYKSCITTRNTIIDMFEREFNRQVKLICKKQDYKALPIGHELRLAVKDSLSRSRNMKKIQAEMTEIKRRINTAALECRNNKRLYVATQSASIKETPEYKRAVGAIQKFETRNEQRAKTSKNG